MWYAVTIFLLIFIIALIDIVFIGGKDGLGRKPYIKRDRRTRK